MEGDEYVSIGIRHNGAWLCIVQEDSRGSGDWSGTSCGDVVSLEEGTSAICLIYIRLKVQLALETGTTKLDFKMN